jgi:glc operon protein GlcG
MRRAWLKSAVALCPLVLASGTQAQQTPPQVPEQMPFDIRYGTPISIDQAKNIAAAAEAEARHHNWKLAIAVVDPDGTLVYFEKMDGTQLGSVAVAQRKARTAALFRRPTKVFQDAVESGRVFVLSLGDVAAVEGGMPLLQNGEIVGAIGCSGALSVQDATACKAGAEMTK